MTASRPRPTTPVDRPPRVFGLYRTDDVSGLTGTGIVAWGAWFPDGRVVTRWCSHANGRSQVIIWDRLSDLLDIHGHGGKSRVVWFDADPVAQRLDTAPLWARYDAYAAALGKATPGSLGHLSLAMQCAAGLPELLTAHDRLADAYAAQTAELEALRAEHTAMQDALDNIADLHQTDTTKGTRT